MATTSCITRTSTSESRSLSKAALVNGVLVAPEVVDRWIDYLEREGLLTRLHDPGGSAGLQLTFAGLASLELYLSDRLQRAGEFESGRGRERAGLPGWAVALLMLGTAILSGTMGWSLAVR